MTEKLIILAMVLSAVAGNVFLKKGAMKIGTGDISGILNIHVFLGIGLFAVAVISYILLLRKIPLHVAQSLMAVQYVGVTLAAFLVFNEKISISALAGIAMITCGIALIGLSEQ